MALIQAIVHESYPVAAGVLDFRSGGLEAVLYPNALRLRGPSGVAALGLMHSWSRPSLDTQCLLAFDDWQVVYRQADPRGDAAEGELHGIREI